MNKKGFYVIPCIGDIHFRNENAYSLYTELFNHFLKYLEDNASEIDACVINGDVFHKKVMFESDASRLCLQFITEILDILDGKPLRIIKGTRTHDHNQLDVFKVFEDRNCLVYNSVTSEELLDDFSVLFMPEEYPKDWKEYYSEYLNVDDADNGKWDTIFMHGMMDFAAHSSLLIESERPIHSSVVFPTETMLKSAITTVASHVHTKMTHKKHLHYISSFSRDAFGEEEAKGFGVLCFNPENQKYTFERIENTDAPLYITKKLSEYYNDDLNLDIFDVIEKMEQDSENVQKLRINVDIEMDDEVKSDLAIIREKVDSEKIKIHLSSKKKTKREREEEDEKRNKREELTRKNIPPDEMIVQFLSMSDEPFEISLDDVREAISPLEAKRKIPTKVS